MKKKAPHVDATWDAIPNDAIVKGSGTVIDSESERRGAIAEKEDREKQRRAAEARKRLGDADVVRAWYADDLSETWEASLKEVVEQGPEWAETG